jgi:hypothetical protein
VDQRFRGFGTLNSATPDLQLHSRETKDQRHVGNKLTIILIWKFGTNIVHLFVQNNVHKNKYYESNNNFHST